MDPIPENFEANPKVIHAKDIYDDLMDCNDEEYEINFNDNCARLRRKLEQEYPDIISEEVRLIHIISGSSIESNNITLNITRLDYPKNEIYYFLLEKFEERLKIEGELAQ